MLFIPQVVETVRAEVDILRENGHGWTLLAVAGGWLVILGLRYLIPALLPQIKAEFSISNSTAGFAITVIWITYAFMQFPAGLLADRFGERMLLIASLLFAAVGVAAISLAPEFVVFLIACGVFGVGTGLYGPSRATAISTIYAPNDEVAFGVVLGAGSLGAALIPLLVQPVTARFGWQIAVGASIPLFFRGVLALRRAMPQVHAAEVSSERSVRGDLGMIIAGIDRRPVLVGVGIATISLFVFQALTAFLPVYLIAKKGISQQFVTVLFAELFISGAVFQVGIGAAANQYGERRVLVVTVLLSTLALFMLPFIHGVPALAVIILGISARFGIPSVVNAYIVGALPEAVHSSGWGLLRTGFFAVAATGSTVVGFLADAGLFDAAMLGLGALTGVTALLIVALSPRQTLEGSE